MRMLIVAFAAAAISMPAMAAEGFGTKVGSAGKWTVYVEKDAMSDETRCTALYDDRSQIQLSPKSLGISYRGRGGVQAYRIRLDEAPAQSLRPATDIERKVGAAVIEGAKYREVLTAQRVRVQAYTLRNMVIDEDIDLSSVGDVQRLFVQAGCAI